MEALTILEKKITDLITLIKQLKAENAKLAQKNVRLTNELKTLKKTVSDGTQSIEKLNQEYTVAKVAMGDLIKSIDLLVENDQ